MVIFKVLSSWKILTVVFHAPLRLLSEGPHVDWRPTLGCKELRVESLPLGFHGQIVSS